MNRITRFGWILFLCLTLPMHYNCSGARSQPADGAAPPNELPGNENPTPQEKIDTTAPEERKATEPTTPPETPETPDTPAAPDKPTTPDAPKPSPDTTGTPDTQHPDKAMDGKLVINELAAAGDPDDWFELYNGTPHDIDLSGYTVADDLMDATKRVAFPAGTTIKSGETKLFTLTTAWPDFKLGKEEELGLWNANGDLLDSVTWKDGDSPDNKSFGRLPHGTGKFQTLDTPTPGTTNQ